MSDCEKCGYAMWTTMDGPVCPNASCPFQPRGYAAGYAAGREAARHEAIKWLRSRGLYFDADALDHVSGEEK